MIVKKICNNCGIRFEINTDDIPAWLETFLCPECEEEIERQMEWAESGGW